MSSHYFISEKEKKERLLTLLQYIDSHRKYDVYEFEDVVITESKSMIHEHVELQWYWFNEYKSALKSKV